MRDVLEMNEADHAYAIWMNVRLVRIDPTALWRLLGGEHISQNSAASFVIRGLRV